MSATVAIFRLRRWLWRLRPAVCRHEFRLADLCLTGIPVPPTPPPGATLAVCEVWANQVIGGNHPSHTDRVQWACCKCGKPFRAHCGLDIYCPAAEDSSRRLFCPVGRVAEWYCHPNNADFRRTLR